MSKPAHHPHMCRECGKSYWFPVYEVATKIIYSQTKEDEGRSTENCLYATKQNIVTDYLFPTCPHCRTQIYHSLSEKAKNDD